ncbi:Uncharacterised protein [uncultured archaeon]|nr:Uncharacterised protein [uncultured archaeon]
MELPLRAAEPVAKPSVRRFFGAIGRAAANWKIFHRKPDERPPRQAAAPARSHVVTHTPPKTKTVQLALGLTVTNPVKIGEPLADLKLGSLTTRQKVRRINLNVRHEPHALGKMRSSSEAAMLIDDIRRLKEYYANELTVSLEPLLEKYEVAKVMERIVVKEGLSDLKGDSLVKLSKGLWGAVDFDPSHSQDDTRCAGEAQTLSSLLNDLQKMQHDLQRGDYIGAIGTYRKKLVPDRGKDGRPTRKDTTKASGLVNKDQLFIRLSEEFVDACVRASFSPAQTPSGKP